MTGLLHAKSQPSSSSSSKTNNSPSSIVRRTGRSPVHLATPLRTLRDLSTAGSSGELVCVTPEGAELHVYLQNGRIAWATDSTAPFAFSRYLLDRCGIAKETFTEVLESCRLDRLPLGETLIQWKVATLEQICEALLHQIGLAVNTMRTCDPEGARSIFLERRFTTYDDRLTFDFERCVALDETLIVEDNNVDTSSTTSAASNETIERAREVVPYATWLELLESERVIANFASDLEKRRYVPQGIASLTLDGDSSLVAIRSVRGAIIGTRMASSPSTSLFCRTDLDTTFALTIGSLSTLAGHPPHQKRMTTDDGGAASSPAFVNVGDNESAVAAFVARAPETLSVLLVEGDGNGDGDGDDAPVRGCHREGMDAAHLIATARRRHRALRMISPDDLGERKSGVALDLEEIGYHLKWIVTRHESFWCFGTEVASTGQTLWMFITRETEQGLGWAYLTSLTRALHSSAP